MPTTCQSTLCLVGGLRWVWQTALVLCGDTSTSFDTAVDIADGKRNRLLPEKVEMLLFLHKNLLLPNFDISEFYFCCH